MRQLLGVVSDGPGIVELLLTRGLGDFLHRPSPVLLAPEQAPRAGIPRKPIVPPRVPVTTYTGVADRYDPADMAGLGGPAMLSFGAARYGSV